MQMGPSGSGKTTALDVLAGRKTVGQVTGKLRYSGMEASASFLRRYVVHLVHFLAHIDLCSDKNEAQSEGVKK